MSLKEKILFASILFFFFTLFFPKIILLTIIAAVIVGISGLAFSPISSKGALFKERRYLQLMVAFFVWIGISVFLSDNFNKGLSFLDPRLALFYFPISIGTLHLHKQFRNKVLLGLALLTTAMSIICMGYGIYRWQTFAQPAFLYNDALTEILGQQSIYYALLVNFSIYILGYFILFTTNRHKWVLVVATLFLFGFSYLLASRIMMATLLLVTLGFCAYYIFSRKRYLEGVTLLIGLLIGGFLIFKFFPQTINRFKELAYTKFEYSNMGKESHYNMAVDSTQWNGANFRLAAWQCGWTLFKEHPVLGVNLGDKRDALFEEYHKRNFQFAIATNKNVHNNYLDILYSLGIIGFVLFALAWLVLPIITAVRYGDGLAGLIIVTFAAAWVSEIYFDRNLGGMLTGFLIPFLLTYTKKERPL